MKENNKLGLALAILGILTGLLTFYLLVQEYNLLIDTKTLAGRADEAASVRITYAVLGWGGISGGMPILAGRVLSIDWIGIVLALSILFWIPTPIMTFSMKYHADYKTAGVPTFPSTYGFPITSAIVAFSSIIAALMIGVAAYGIGMAWGYLRILVVLSTALLTLAIGSLMRPSERLNFGLFKFASVYMLSSMVLMVTYGF